MRRQRERSRGREYDELAFVGSHLEGGIHPSYHSRSGFSLALGHVPRAEEKLAVEVGFLDSVGIRDCDEPALARGKPHHGPVLEHLHTDERGVPLSPISLAGGVAT